MTSIVHDYPALRDSLARLRGEAPRDAPLSHWSEPQATSAPTYRTVKIRPVPPLTPELTAEGERLRRVQAEADRVQHLFTQVDHPVPTARSEAVRRYGRDGREVDQNFTVMMDVVRRALSDQPDLIPPPTRYRDLPEHLKVAIRRSPVWDPVFYRGPNLSRSAEEAPDGSRRWAEK